VLWLVSELYIL